MLGTTIPTQNLLNLALCSHDKKSTKEDMKNVLLNCINASHDGTFSDIKAYLRTEFRDTPTVRSFLEPSIEADKDKWTVNGPEYLGEINDIRDALSLPASVQLTREIIDDNMVVLDCCNNQKVRKLHKKSAEWVFELRKKLTQCERFGWMHTFSSKENNIIVDIKKSTYKYLDKQSKGGSDDDNTGSSDNDSMNLDGNQHQHSDADNDDDNDDDNNNNNNKDNRKKRKRDSTTRRDDDCTDGTTTVSPSQKSQKKGEVTPRNLRRRYK